MNILKRLRLLFFIFSLLFVSSIPTTYGQEQAVLEHELEGDRISEEVVSDIIGDIIDEAFFGYHPNSYGSEIIVASAMIGIILGCMLVGDLLTDTCTTRWHPGDYYYEKNYKIMKTKNIEAWECYNNKKCVNQVDMNVVMGATRPGGGMSFGECRQNCINEVIKSAPNLVAHCAKKKTDGYYSDGSYYYSSSGSDLAQLFNNTHKNKDKYKKNEWQKARDECMDIARKQNGVFSSQIIYDSYNDCLKERGF